MKKSFMTRALATGLSFAMAFSLSAATNVTTASAAAKKAKVTTFMKVSEKAVTEGKSVTTYMKSNVAKKYRIKSHTETATAKKYISVKMKDSRKGLTITAKEGALAAVNLEKKGVNVKINFAPGSTAAKAKKNAATKYVNLKVVVNAKPEAKLTMTAEATGVKKIAVTFNKAVDTTTTKIVVKKGSATPTITSTTFASDAKGAEIVMGTKLTAGTYTVEATVGEEKFVADITVENEKMTEFKLVSPNLVADPDVTTTATISYKAVNQYGEAMPASKISASCSFGKIESGDLVEPKADKNGKITVTDIPTTLAIEGQTGTLVIVNQENGVNLNETITYRSKAVASSANVLGIYSTKTDKLIEGNLKVKDTASEYQILVNIQDQYNNDMDVSAIEKSKCDVSLNPAKVLTDLDLDVNASKVISSDKAKDKTYDGKSCVAIPLKADSAKIAKAGTLSLTIVSANKGVLATPSFVVDDVVLIESFNVSAADTIYDNEKNKLVVEAYDVNGNAVTKFDDLKEAFKETTDNSPVTIEKNSDGTATFYYDTKTKNVFTKPTTKQNTSIPQTVMFYANEPTSGKYIVKPVSLTVYEAKVPVKVAGVANDAITAVAVSDGAILSFDMTKLTIEDQYSNTKGYSDLSDDDKTNVKVYLKDNAVIFQKNTASVSDKKIKLTSNGKKGDATLYLKYQTSAAGGDNKVASDDNYDIKLTLSAVDVSNLTASDMTLKVNDGNKIYGADKVKVEASMDAKKVGSSKTGSTVTCSAIVTAKVAGKNVVVPTHMYTIIEGTYLGEYGKVNDSDGKGGKYAEKTEEKTVKAVYGNAGKEVISTTVTVSNADAKAVEIKKADSKKVPSVGTGLAKAIKIVDQYGNTMTGKESEIIYNITFTGKNADVLQDGVKKNGTQAVYYDGNTSLTGTTASVTYTYAGLTFTTDVEFE